MPAAARSAWREVAAVFFRLGCTAFGGPAAHLALMREELVVRRRWVDDGRFLRMMALTQLIPGPNSTEMAIYLGLVRAGWPGLVVAGVGFIVPPTLMVLALAWAYATYGSLEWASGALYGFKPVVVAVVLQAILGLAREVPRHPATWVGGLAVALLYLRGVHELALLLGGGALIALALGGLRRGGATASAAALTGAAAGAAAVSGAAAAVPYSPHLLFLSFLQVGATLYGSGYVLLAFLRSQFVHRLGWLSDAQVLDAVAVGQLTPGPVFTAATFVGYLVGGVPGGLWATLGIFLPSFFLVALVHRAADRLLQHPWAERFLDGVQVAALALMAAVTAELARGALVDPVAWVLAGASWWLLVKKRVNSAWLLVAGAAVGMLRAWLTG